MEMQISNWTLNLTPAGIWCLLPCNTGRPCTRITLEQEVETVSQNIRGDLSLHMGDMAAAVGGSASPATRESRSTSLWLSGT